MSFSTFCSTLELGMIYSFLALGIMIPLRILDFPDLSADGSFVTGMALSADLCLLNHPLLGLIAAFCSGAICGLITGILHTKLKVQAILSGILTMTALYSINLKIMGNRPTISLFNIPTVFTMLRQHDFKGFELLSLFVLLIAVLLVLTCFFKTTCGIALRATGSNEEMVRACSFDTDTLKIIGLMLANALVALSGALICQFQSFADNTCGTGMLVLGAASIILGETIFHAQSIFLKLAEVSFGAVAYRFVLTIAYQCGMPSTDLKLFSALLVLAAIAFPLYKKKMRKRGDRHA